MSSKRLRAVAVLACLTLAFAFFNCNAQEMTKTQRLENTLYLQNNNYASAKDGVLTVIDKDEKR